MRNKALIAVVIALSFLLCSCSKGSLSSSTDSQDYVSSEIAVSAFPNDSKYNGSAESSFSNSALLESRSFTTSKKDTNALRLEGGEFTVAGVTVTKKGGTTENSSLSRLFGLNSALFIRAGAKVTIKDSEILSKVPASASLFAYSDKTAAELDSVLISSSGKRAAAVIAAGGASIKATNSSVRSVGENSVAIFSGDGGKIELNKVSASTEGLDGPVILCEGELIATDCDFTATKSYPVEIKSGGNAVLKNCEISGTRNNFQDITDTDLYTVSLAGDDNPAKLTLENCSFSNAKRDIFKLSGKTELTLNNCKIEVVRGDIFRILKDSDAVINFEQVNFSGILPNISGAKAELHFKDGSSFYGEIVTTKENPAYSVTLEKGCKLSLSGDTYLAAFSGDLNDVEISGNLYVAGEKVK